MSETPEFTVSQAIAVFNQILETATPNIIVTGEVANYKVNQGKWVFFDLKDETGILSCFMPVWQLRVAIQDGMKVKVGAYEAVMIGVLVAGGVPAKMASAGTILSRTILIVGTIAVGAVAYHHTMTKYGQPDYQAANKVDERRDAERAKSKAAAKAAKSKAAKE